VSKIHHSVLWIPTFYHDHLTAFIDKKHFKGTKEIDTTKDINLQNVEISDGMGNHFCYLDLTLKEAKNKKYPDIRDIWIGVRVLRRSGKQQSKKFSYGAAKNNTKTQYKRTLTLKCKDVSRNGLIQYAYEIPEDFDPKKHTHPLINSDMCITHAVYHAIKEFFHEHKFHNSPKDSIINPYHHENKTLLSSNDNPALLHYLLHFEAIFLNAAKDIDKSVNKVMEYRQSPEGELMAYALNELKDLLEKCNKILGFGVYYWSLCASKYNNSFKKECLSKKTGKPEKDQETQDDEKKQEKEYYQCAINVENTLNYVRVIEEQYRDFYYTVTAALNQYNQEQIFDSQDKFSNIQKKMDRSIVAIQDIQLEAVDLQTQMGSSIGEVKQILSLGNKTSKRSFWTGVISLVITALSLGYAIYTKISSNNIPPERVLNLQTIPDSLYTRIDSFIRVNKQMFIDPTNHFEQETKQSPKITNCKIK
jgi:hypothetical protein